MELGNCQELRWGHGNLVSYQTRFSQQPLYLKHLFTEFTWLWWQTHETVTEREEEGRKRLLGKWKAEFCCLRNIHWKKHICAKYLMALMVFQWFILCLAYFGSCEKWVTDHLHEAHQELLPKTLTKSKATTTLCFTEEQVSAYKLAVHVKILTHQ